MKVRTLQVDECQMAQLRVHFQMARISIDSRFRKIKQMQQQSAQMRVTHQDPAIEVDMSKLRNNIGLKDSAALTQDMAKSAVSKSEQAIRTMHQNADYIAKMPRDGNPIAQIARRNLLAVPQPAASGEALDPTVDVQGTPGSINIDWSLQDVAIVWDDFQMPIITVEPKTSVDVELAQEQRLTFKVVEQSIPPEAGRTIDAEA